MYPEDHEADRLECISQSVGVRPPNYPDTFYTHCSSLFGHHYVSHNCTTSGNGDEGGPTLDGVRFLHCMSDRAHFHLGSEYNLAQPAVSGSWSCQEGPGIDCAALKKAHDLRTRVRRGEKISGEERKFLYDIDMARIREQERELGMTK